MKLAIESQLVLAKSLNLSPFNVKIIDQFSTQVIQVVIGMILDSVRKYVRNPTLDSLDSKLGTQRRDKHVQYHATGTGLLLATFCALH